MRAAVVALVAVIAVLVVAAVLMRVEERCVTSETARQEQGGIYGDSTKTSSSTTCKWRVTFRW